MLVQMSEATLTLLLTMLAVGAVIRFMPAAGHGRRGKLARSRAAWGGIIAGFVSSLYLTLLILHDPKSVNRQTVGLYTLPFAVVLALVFLALVAVRARRMRAHLPGGDADDEAKAASSMETALPGDFLVRLVGAAFIALVLFRAVPTAMNQAIMMTSGGVAIYSTPMVLAIVGYMLAWLLVFFLAWLSYRLCSWNNRVWPAAVILAALLANYALLFVRILKAKRWIKTSKEAWEVISWFINNEAVFTIVAAVALGAVVVRDVARVARDPHRRVQPRREPPGPRPLAPVQVHGWHRRDRLPVRRPAHHRGRGLRQPGDRAFAAGILQRRRGPGERQPGRYFRRPPAPLRVHDLGRREGALHRHPEVWLLLRRGPGCLRDLRASGYYEKDGKVICKLCEVAMNIATIGFKGGCNPIPIDYKVSNGTLTVPISALEASASIFAK